MKQLSSKDSIFVYGETPLNPLHIAALFIYEPPKDGEDPVRFKDVLAHFEKNLHKSPLFRQKLAKVPLNADRPYWVDDANFNLELHVRHIALPKPGDWRQFCILLARLHSHPLDMSRPPWEAYIIEGLDNITGLPTGSFAMYLKMHHSAFDGMASVEFVSALHDLKPDSTGEQQINEWQPERNLTNLKMLGNAYLNTFKMPKKIWALTKHVAKSQAEWLKETLGERSESHPVKDRIRFNDKLSQHRIFGGLRMELSEIKFIRKAFGDCTINDVMLSIVGGTLRKYLNDKNELPNSPLVVCVPINTRTDAATSDDGNEISAMLYHLGTHIESPTERVRMINMDAVNTKAYADTLGNERISTLIDAIPPGIASLSMMMIETSGLGSRTKAIANTVVTNVVGPQVPLYFCGAKGAVVMGVGCPMDGLGLFHTVSSYNDYISLTYVSCREMMPDPDVYHSCLNASLQEHVEAAKERYAKQLRESNQAAEDSTEHSINAKTMETAENPLGPADRAPKKKTTKKSTGKVAASNTDNSA